MHDKALALLKECAVVPPFRMVILSSVYSLAKDESDINDKLDPSVRYLQKLGPDHLSLVLTWSNWVMDVSTAKGLMVYSLMVTSARFS